MTIKQLAFDTHQYLQTTTGATFKRAHVYELLAAALGFNSYAAFSADYIFTQNSISSRHPDKHEDRVGRRCLELGYSPEISLQIARVLPQRLEEQDIGGIRIGDLVAILRFETGRAYQREYPLPDEEEEDEPDYRKLDPASTPSSILIDGLSFAAKQGNALAHYALALLYAPSDDPLDAPSAGSEFWYTEEQNGRQLTGVEKEWADSYIAMVKHEEKYEHHLRKAGELGQFEALLELAERFGDPAFFVRPFTPSPSMDPARISRIAEELGRLEDARKWLAEAARQGNVEAMRELIEGYDSGDLEQCWTWFYLADLLGTNLSEDRYEAIHEDGSSYDDDVGGPLFITGDDGVDLEPLDAAADTKAREAAKTLYESLMA